MKHIDNCINEFDSSALDEVAALNKIIKTIKSIKEKEDIPIKESYNRFFVISNRSGEGLTISNR